MKVERLGVKACCGSVATAFQLDAPISKDILPVLISNGFVEAKHFTKAGMLYAENAILILSCPFGSNIVHIKCKNTNCVSQIDILENLFSNLS